MFNYKLKLKLKNCKQKFEKISFLVFLKDFCSFSVITFDKMVEIR
jgi:hypothetical protein